MEVVSDNRKLEYNDISEMLECAEACITEYCFDQAIEILNRILEKEPNHNDALNNLAIIKIQENRISEAYDILAQLLASDPENKTASENMSVLNAYYGQSSEQKKVIRELYKIIEMYAKVGLNNPVVRGCIEKINHIYTQRMCMNTKDEFVSIRNSPINAEEGNVLLRIALEKKISRSLEVGMAFGLSTLHILLAHEILNSEGHIAIDPYQFSEYYQGCGLRNISACNLEKHFHWINMKSSIALPMLLQEDATFDLIFIDGSHLFGDIFVDVYYSFNLLSENGIIILHDSFLPASRTVRNIFMTNYGLQHYDALPNSNMIALKKQNSKIPNWRDFTNAFKPFYVETD
jgi:predicted O-methyltransferase YrrM